MEAVKESSQNGAAAVLAALEEFRRSINLNQVGALGLWEKLVVAVSALKDTDRKSLAEQGDKLKEHLNGVLADLRSRITSGSIPSEMKTQYERMISYLIPILKSFEETLNDNQVVSALHTRINEFITSAQETIESLPKVSDCVGAVKTTANSGAPYCDNLRRSVSAEWMAKDQPLGGRVFGVMLALFWVALTLLVDVMEVVRPTSAGFAEKLRQRLRFQDPAPAADAPTADSAAAAGGPHN